MKLAAIDIGSNTVRLLVAHFEAGRVLPLRHEREVTRLASGIHNSGLIADGPLGKSLDVLRRFAAIAKQEGVQRIKAVATSAIREAQNGNDAAIRMSEAAGVDVEVISGYEEAGITALGVLQGFGSLENAIIFDLGGGSTEFIYINEGKLVLAETIPIGVVKLHEGCPISDPPTEGELSGLIAHIDSKSGGVLDEFRAFAGPAVPLIGTAGTATTLASVNLGLEKYDWQRVQGHMISIDRLRQMQGLFASLPLAGRRLIKGMDPSRADLLIAGCGLTIRVMETLGYDSMTVSDHGLLEGLIVALRPEVRP